MADSIQRARLEPQASERFVRLRAPLGVNSFGINQIILEPGQRNRIHRHRDQEEVILVLEGRLTLMVEGEPQLVDAGELVRVAPEVRRQLVNRGPERVSLLALGGHSGHQHEPRDAEAYASWDDREPGSPQDIPIPGDLDPSELESA